MPANFIFASVGDGKIRAWRGGSTAALVTADRSHVNAHCAGLAIAQPPTGSPLICAADVANARVDVFNGSWQLVTAPGAFVDRA